MQNVIEARGLTKRYADSLAVAGIDLAVGPGEVVAVLGPNGAGKTTTIEMLLGMRTPTSGSVRVFGRRPEDRRVRARVGAMLQDSAAPDSLTVGELVGLVGHYYPRARPVGDVLARADLTGQARHRVGQLSGGQRQRLSFALAVVGDPDLLFLDEPTASLDVAARVSFWLQMAELAGNGRTVLFATHHLEEADRHADRVVLIHHGRVVQDGTPAQVRASVADTTLELRTDAAAAWVAAMPEVRHVAASGPGGLLTIQTTAAEAILARLFAAGSSVSDLTVTHATLESAFLHLTGQVDEAERVSA